MVHFNLFNAYLFLFLFAKYKILGTIFEPSKVNRFVSFEGESVSLVVAFVYLHHGQKFGNFAGHHLAFWAG